MKFTIVHKNEASLVPKGYGVWIPEKGWLAAQAGEPQVRKVYMEAHRHVAQSVARRCSKGARVEYIDMALVDLENYLKAVELERAEAKKLRKGIIWRMLKTFNRNIS